MKKLKSLFLCPGLSAIFVVSGCGKGAVDPAIKEQIDDNAVQLISEIASESVDKNALSAIDEEEYSAMAQEWEEDGIVFESKEVFDGAVKSSIAAEDEAGKAYMRSDTITVSGNPEDGYNATKLIAYTERNVNMNIAFDPDMKITDITFSPVYSMGEAMTKAALNTLLGMGSVFCVLVLIMCLIYMFGIIPKIQKAVENKKKANEKVSTEESVDKTIANIVEKEEGELVDDLELVAVISAAIAAYEGNGTTDGFVVRSIKKSQSKKWQNAQY